MALLDGKQLRDQSTSLDKLRGHSGLVTFTASATMSFAAGSVLRQADENILVGHDVVNKNYVDSVAQGLHIKESVHVLATSPITLIGTQTIDNHPLQVGERVLVNGQDNANATASNGIYVVAAGAWSRATDSDGVTTLPNGEVQLGDFVFVVEGQNYAGTGWVLNTSDSSDFYILVGTESQKWTQFSSAGVITPGDGLVQTGTDFHVNTGTGLTISSDQVVIANTGVTASNYGTDDSVAAFTVNAQGQIVSAQSITIDISSSQVNDFDSAAEAAVFETDNFVDGQTVDFTVFGATGVGAEVKLGSLTASRFDIINSASASQGWKLGYNTTGQFEWFDPSQSDISEVIAGSGLTGGGVAGAVTLDVNTSNGLTVIADSVQIDQSAAGNGLTFSAGVFAVNTANGLTINGDNVEIDANAAGNGLAFAAGVFSVNTANGLTINGDNVEINQTAAGNGLTFSAGVFAVNTANGLTINGDNVEINSTAAGTGLSFNAGVFDVNIAAASGLTFSGDNLALDSGIAGNGLDYAAGVLTVNTSEITSSLAGDGLIANGSALDVQVDTTGLTVSGDTVRLQTTITGDRTFADTVTVNGNLQVNGTVSYIYTENVYIEDNILTLNATFSGTPFLNAGIEVNRGAEAFASLIWNETTDLWSAGLSGSETSILLNAGTGLTKNGATVSLDFVSIVGTGLTQNGSQISINTTGFATALAGDGLAATGGTLSVNTANGLSVISDNVELGGTLNKDTTIDGAAFDFTIQNFDTLTLTGSVVDVQLDNGLFLVDAGSSGSIDLYGGDVTIFATGSVDITTTNGFTVTTGTGSITTSNLEGLVYTADYSSTFVTQSLVTKGYVDAAVAVINGDFITGVTAGNGLSGGGTAGFVTLDVNLEPNSGLTFSGDNITIDASFAGEGLDLTNGILSVNVADGLLIDGDDIKINPLAAGNGLTFSGGVFAVNTANGLTINNDNVEVAQTIAGQGLTFSSGVVDMVWGGTATGTTFSNDAVAVVVDNTTIQINSSGQLTVVAGASQPVYQNITAVNTTGNDAIVTGATLTSTPNDYSRIQVYVNGQLQRLGNNNIVQDCYFGTSGTAKALSALASGDQLYWNGNNAGFDLATSDKIDIVYEA
jgi:hypothetical protein